MKILLYIFNIIYSQINILSQANIYHADIKPDNIFY